MSESSVRRQRWLNAITLIICIGILWGLLMPAVNTMPRGARRTQCMNNTKNLALATVNFETTKKQYPGYQASFGKRSDGSAKIGSWTVSLLPYLEEQSLRDEWDDPTQNDLWLAATKGENKVALKAFYPTITVLICPADTLQKAELAGMSYAANAGFHLMSNDPALGMDLYTAAVDASERSTISQRAANGMFANRLGPQVIDPKSGKLTKVFGYCAKPTTSDDVRDGTSNTLMFAENSNELTWQVHSIADESARSKLGIVWLYASKSASEGRPTPMPITEAMRINRNKLYTGSGPLRARPSGMHSSVVVAAFADGSIKSISEEIDYHVYQSLMAPHDAKSDIPNLNYVLKEQDYFQ